MNPAKLPGFFISNFINNEKSATKIYNFRQLL